MSFYKIFNLSVKKFLKRPSKQNFMPHRTYNEVRFEDIPNVSLSIIKNSLKKYQIAFEDGPTNFVIGCQICEKNGKTKIFINKRTGAFTCESCRHTGSWLQINSYISAKHEKRKVSKDPIIVCELENLMTYLKAVKKNTNVLGELDDETFKIIKDKFSLPETISKSHLDALGIRLDITLSNLFLPLQNSSNELVSYKVLNATSSSTSPSISSSIQPKLPNTQSSGVLISKLSKSKTCVLVSNVSDFLVLYAASIPYTVAYLPSGLHNLSQHVLPCFERYNKLVIWFGNDLAAWETARNFAKKLGEKRCLFIRPLEKSQLPHMDPSQDFSSIILSAQPIWHKSITTFASLRQDVLADLKNIDRVQGVKWSRYPSLNRILKGHRRGELTVFTGPTGSGKTTFISEYSLDLAMQGVNTLWGSFEIRNARLARTMLQQLAGIPLDENLDQYDYWADIFEELPIYYMTFHGQQSIKIVMEAIEHAVYVHDINHVIIDNLQFMMGMSEDTRHMDRFWKQDLIVANFRTFATRRNCHVTLVIHPRKEKEDDDLTTSSIFGGAKASQEADNILIIQDKRLASIKGRKYLQICKNRYSGDLGIMPLEFDKASLCFAPKKKKEAKKKSDVVESS